MPQDTGHLFVTPNGRYLYGLSATQGSLTVIDLRTDKIVKTVSDLGVVTALAFDASGKYAYVPNTNVGTIYQISTATMSVVGQIPLGTPGDELDGLAVQSTAKGDRLYVIATPRIFLYVLDVSSGAISKITVHSYLRTATLAGDQLVLAHGLDSGVDQIDTATGKVTRLRTPTGDISQSAALVGPHTVAIASGATAWLDTITHHWSRAVRRATPATCPASPAPTAATP